MCLIQVDGLVADQTFVMKNEFVFIDSNPEFVSLIVMSSFI